MRLRELGALLALDVLVNNCDRLPLIWDNQGNAGNVMLGLHDGQVIAIDSQIICIDPALHPVNLDAYIAKVDALLAALTSKPSVEDARVHSVRKVIMQHTDYDVGEAGSVEIQRGLLAVVAATADSGAGDPSFRDESKAWIDALRAYDPPLVGVDLISIDFLSRTWQCLQKYSAAAAAALALASDATAVIGAADTSS